MKFRFTGAFTLIELLVTITILGILVSLAVPQVGRAIEKANSIKCSNNLRQIGISVGLYAQDNDNRFPTIESMPSDPVYASVDSNGEKPGTLLEVLSPYGITESTLKCPSDLRGPNYFKKEGSSYAWRNIVDDEIASAPKVYSRRGVRNPMTAWLLLTTDYEAVHNGHVNRLYADGHIRSF
jgi:prepilin-type N-terminal cleavage/methylation domain-containing protein/prepilin-type processing-associated H-X9-DG protein